ncbi:MAG: TlpA family protein disulfide reductase [Saprospiraceae bacterium]|nr:TlpA family protein disulfide reductase [Saprospiraceae bacterium]
MRQNIYAEIAYLIIALVVQLPAAMGQSLSLQVEVAEASVGQVTLEEGITTRQLLKIEAKTGTGTNFRVDYYSTGVLRSTAADKSYLVCLTPARKIKLRIAADSSLTTHHLADSLLNYLWKSNNNFIVENGSLIFNPRKPSDVLPLFEAFRKERAVLIQSQADRLSAEELALLQYQNDARIYSFLFYFGRMVQNLPAEDTFFDFVEAIDPENPWTKTLPQNILYRFEVNYLRRQDSLQSISAFTDYIKSSTQNKDQAAFYQAIYLKELMESPSYWTKHVQLFDAAVLEKALAAQNQNDYRYLLEKSSANYFHAQKGEVAFDFTAVNREGEEVKLSDFAGKFVFIDNWASWCGPCIRHRPTVLELSRQFADQEDIVFLMVSVDAKEQDWNRYFSRQTEDTAPAADLLVENGMEKTYGDRYNIRFIPKYVLIDPNGKIIDANLPEPGPGLERLLRQHLTP